MSQSGARRGKLLASGVVVLVVGVVAAAGLWFAAGAREESAIKGLARAPVGCDTTLDFDTAGEFLIFVETEGVIGDLAGNCGVSGSFETTEQPSVRITMLDPEGRELDLDSRAGTSYNGAGFAGESVRVVAVDVAGDHVVRVEGPADNVAVAIGRDPGDGVSLLQTAAAVALGAALVIGGLLLAFGARRRPVPLALEGAPWQPAGHADWVTTPPGMPQPSQPPGAGGWQPAVGPPSQLPPHTQPAQAPAPSWAPGGTPQAPIPPAPQPQPTPQPQQQPATTWAPQPPAAPQPTQRQPGSPETGAPDAPAPAWQPSPSDGSTGDGQRSPWAPPGEDAAQ